MMACPRPVRGHSTKFEPPWSDGTKRAKRDPRLVCVALEKTARNNGASSTDLLCRRRWRNRAS